MMCSNTRRKEKRKGRKTERKKERSLPLIELEVSNDDGDVLCLDVSAAIFR